MAQLVAGFLLTMMLSMVATASVRSNVTGTAPNIPAQGRDAKKLADRTQLTERLRSVSLDEATLGKQGRRPQSTESTEEQSKLMMWKITGRGRREADNTCASYLLGAMHLPDPRLLKLPVMVERAFTQCDVFYSEKADMDLNDSLNRPPGSTYRSRIKDPELMARFAATIKNSMTLKHVGILFWLMCKVDSLTVAQTWESMWKTCFLGMLVYHLALYNDCNTGPCIMYLDEHLRRRAMGLGKQERFLETHKDHVHPFESLSENEQRLYLKLALDDVAQVSNRKINLQKSVSLYLAGDFQGLQSRSPCIGDSFTCESSTCGKHTVYRRFLHLFRPDREAQLARKLNHNLFSVRNRQMCKRMAACLRSEPTRSHFFAIGAGHLGGKGGVIELLQKRGFNVTRADPHAVA